MGKASGSRRSCCPRDIRCEIGCSCGKRKAQEKSPGPRDEGFWGERAAFGLTSGVQGIRYLTMSPIAAIRTDQVAKMTNRRFLISADNL